MSKNILRVTFLLIVILLIGFACASGKTGEEHDCCCTCYCGSNTIHGTATSTDCSETCDNFCSDNSCTDQIFGDECDSGEDDVSSDDDQSA